ncbi:hypothetical protein [Catellatospora sp. NPDC049609]|uniref:hypothetical protein n=1 Tax=Catellatospora sp. NPDC049609 TaxID=3155505 RepID=UPI003441B644
MSIPVPPLPEVFEVHIGRQAQEAQAAGRPEEAEKAIGYLVSEGATSAEEAKMFGDVARASLLARTMLEHVEAGRAAEADALQARIVDEYGPEVAKVVLAGLLVTAGRKQGWLPVEAYDLLMQLTDGGRDVADIIQGVGRGQPTD